MNISYFYKDIVEMLDQGYNPKNISRVLGCTLSMVYEVLEQREKGNTEVFSPYETVNS